MTSEIRCPGCGALHPVCAYISGLPVIECVYAPPDVIHMFAVEGVILRAPTDNEGCHNYRGTAVTCEEYEQMQRTKIARLRAEAERERDRAQYYLGLLAEREMAWQRAVNTGC